MRFVRPIVDVPVIPVYKLWIVGVLAQPDGRRRLIGMA